MIKLKQNLEKSLAIGIIALFIGLGIFPAVNPTIIGNETKVVAGENVLSQGQELANVTCCFYTLDGLEEVTSNKFSLSYMSAKDIGLCKIGNNFNLKKDYEADIPVIYISASSDYEYGLKEGSALRPYYIGLINWAKRFFSKTIEEKHLLHHVEVLEQCYPSFLNRLRGISDALGVNVMDLIKLELLFSSLASGIGGCTISGVSPKVTRDNQTYLSLNVDVNYLGKILLSRYIRPPPFVICDIAGKYKYVKLGLIPSAIFGFGFLNEKGLAYAGATVRTTERGDGLTSLELNNLAMESCATVEEVENIYRESERESGSIVNPTTLFGVLSSLNTLWADSKGDIMVIEYTHNRIVTKKSLLLAETNHYQFLDESNGLTTKGFFLRGSIARLERAYELLNEYNGSIDVNFYKNIFTCDHRKGLRKNRPDSWDICRHALLYGTVCSIIIIPNRYGLYYCPGHPCRVGFRYLDFSKELGNISTA